MYFQGLPAFSLIPTVEDRVCMLKQILSETEINFNDLEKEIFKIGCQYAQNVMVEILRSLDKKIAETRDKKQYRHKGKRKTTIKT